MLRPPIQRFGLLCLCLMIGHLVKSQEITAIPSTCNGCTGSVAANCFEFTIDNQDINNPNDYDFFWVFGDGTVKYETHPNGTGSIVHCYPPNNTSQAQEYYPFVEYHLMDNYIDDEPPKRATINDSFDEISVPTSGTFITSFTNPQERLGNLDYRLSSSRIPVAGHTISYLVEVKNNCQQTISSINYKLTVSNKLMIETELPNPPFYGLLNNVYVYPNTNTSVNGNIAAGYNLTFANLAPGEERTVVFLFKVKDNIELGETIDAQLAIDGNCIIGEESVENSNCQCGKPPRNKGQIGEAVQLSHDPNYLLSGNDLYCDDQLNDVFDYTIRFQNTGVGDTEDIKVKVWLDEDIDLNTVQYRNNSTFSLLGTPSFSTSPTEHWIEWTLDNAILKGTGHPQYNIDFYEDETVGYIHFTAGINTTNYPNLLSCDAFPARAAIYFDCNEPVVTNNLILPLGCLGPSPGNPCTTCTQIDTLSPISITFPGDTASIEMNTPLRTFLDNLGVTSGSYNRQWFPIQNMLSGTSKMDYPILLKNPPAYPIEYYTLIASDPINCARWVIEIPVEWPSCDLAFATAHDVVYLCDEPYLDSYTATFTDPNNNGPYLWQNCDSGTSKTLVLNNLLPGKYPIHVQDNDGCFASMLLEVKTSYPPLHAEATWNGCNATVVAVGGNPPYSLKTTSSNIFSGTQTSIETLGTAFNAKYKSLVVEDSNGCKVTIRNSCGLTSWPDYLPWVLVAIGVILVGILLTRQVFNGG